MKEHSTYKVNGRHLEEGVEFSVPGPNGGRFRFVKATESSDGKISITGVGGKRGNERTRSFRPHAIKTVHSKIKTRRVG